jgi:hypothetical protein
VDEEPLPGTERRQWDRGALHVAERCRLRRQDPSRDRGVLGRNPVAVERSKRIHLVADRNLGDADTGRDHTGQLVRRNRRQPIERPLELVTRDGGGMYFDEYLACSKWWRLDRLVPKPVDAGSVQADCLHRSRNSHVDSILILLSSKIYSGEFLSATIHSRR